MKHRLLISLIGILILGIFAACSSSDGAKESSADSDGDGELSGELVIFNWSEYMPDEIIEGFEEEFGIDVVYTTFSSNQEMLAKIKSGTVAYDIAVPSGSFVEVLKDEGLLNEINFDNIPNYQHIDDTWKSQDFDPDNKYSVVYMYGYDGIYYNKSKVEKPTSWEDLWNPDYKGHVIVVDAPDEISDMLQLYLGNDMNDPTEEQIEESADLFKDLIPNVLKFTETPKAELVSEEAWIGYGYSGEAAAAYIENEDIDFVIPKEGGIKWSDNMVIPSSSQNQEAAEAFINYLLRPEVSQLLSEEFPYNNPNTSALELIGGDLDSTPGYNLSEEEIENTYSSTVLDPDRTQLVNRVIQEAIVAGGN